LRKTCIQRAVWRNGGSSPQKVQWKLATACPAGSSVEAATTPSRHYVIGKRRTCAVRTARENKVENEVQFDKLERTMK